MTPQERITRARQGESADRKPTMVWSISPGHEADVVTSPIVELSHALKTYPDQLVLAEVLSPLSRALRRDYDLNTLLTEDPEFGNAKLDELVGETQVDILTALDKGAAGIFYLLDGAFPTVCTPMQYGGYYLERDRELLELADEALFNVLYLLGEDEIYFDFVADLPAHAMCWSARHQALKVAEARNMTKSLIALDHVEADVLFAHSFDEAARLLSRLESASA
jgi:hypothetical protein